MNASDLSVSFAGCEKLISLFGRWPTFHDAEVYSFELQRSGGTPLTSPVCSVTIALSYLERGAPTEHDGPLVVLRFFDVCDLRLVGFDHQNSILGLQIVLCDTTTKPHPLPSHVYDVSFLAVHELGFSASFTCSRVEVVSVSSAGA